MKSINVLKRLKNIIPNHIKPKFNNEKELLKWNEKKGQVIAKHIIQKNKNIKIKKKIAKSGIQKLYINCSFENYKIQHLGHKKVMEMAKKYAMEFNKKKKSFVFSGKSGTGKNHLASAIGNYLLLNGKKILIITITDLMSNIKETFKNDKNKNTEKKILDKLGKIDLLVIDEIGVQTKSQYERIIINQIIEKRSSSKKATGMLSNLNYKEMNSLLGERVMDRMCAGNNLWLNFRWESYRKYT